MRVVIIGAGPVGMLLGGELARLGVEHITLEAREAPGAGSRAIGIHSAALTAMSASGVTDRILSACLQVREGQARVGAATVTTIRFDAVRAGSLASFPFVATLPQAATESVIAAAAASNGAPAPERGVQVLDVIDEGATCRVITDSGDVHGDAVVIAAGSRSRHISSLIRDGGAARTPTVTSWPTFPMTPTKGLAPSSTCIRMASSSRFRYPAACGDTSRGTARAPQMTRPPCVTLSAGVRDLPATRSRRRRTSG